MSWLAFKILTFKKHGKCYHWSSLQLKHTPFKLLISSLPLLHATLTCVSTCSVNSSRPVLRCRRCTGWLDVHPDGWHVTLFAGITIHFCRRAAWSVRTTNNLHSHFPSWLSDFLSLSLLCGPLQLDVSLVCKNQHTLLSLSLSLSHTHTHTNTLPAKPVRLCPQPSHFSAHVQALFSRPSLHLH